LDDDPELVAQGLLDWCEYNRINPRHIQPGNPTQEGYVKRYNRSFRDEVLDAYVFDDLEQVREISAGWLWIYNDERPHDALESQPPAVFRALIESKTTSTSELST